MLKTIKVFLKKIRVHIITKKIFQSGYNSLEALKIFKKLRQFSSEFQKFLQHFKGIFHFKEFFSMFGEFSPSNFFT